MVPQLLTQLFKKPFTNKFPAKYIPSSPTKFLKDVENRKVSPIPPVETPHGFRGKIRYERDKCTGCKLCITVCPSGTIEFKPEERKVKFYLARCTFCSQCTDVCPVNCLSMSNEFLLADIDKYSKDLIVE
jgi:formate hydrogenlyase subunit 6/NADH:ubiquinone oxidoreductase subunit I